MKRVFQAFLFALFLVPFASVGHAATVSNEFLVAAQLLSAAKNADIQQVQALISSGANVNYVDSTGLSLVCTALMNNDVRAAQILQMYGADASQCDRQIKQYESRTKPQVDSGGLFSGLSSAQNIALAAAGAAVVVGGLFLLTDWLDPGNENGNGGSGSGGNRPGQGENGGGSSGGESWASGQIPYGPAMPNAAAEADYYVSNLNYYSPESSSDDEELAGAALRSDIFKLMTNTYRQNYLLMMHGYSALARGYMGQRTLRRADGAPFTSAEMSDLGVGGIAVTGGRPVTVALVTTNGINAAPKPAGAESAEKNSLDDELLAWTGVNNDKLQNAEISMISSKYYNNSIQLGTGTADTITNSYTYEDGTLVDDFDLSGSGTAINNVLASKDDDLLAKVIGGNMSGYSTADFIGFMPNGQMLVYRTGGGKGMVALGASDSAATGTATIAGEALATDDTLTLFGKTLKITRTGNAITAVDTSDEEAVYSGYIGADGLLYISSTPGGTIDQAYKIDSTNLTQVKKAGTLDYKNYAALRDAMQYRVGNEALNTTTARGRSMPLVLANASVIEPLHDRGAATINDVLAVSGTDVGMTTGFLSLVNQYYNNNKTDGTATGDDGTADDSLPATDAAAFFNAFASLGADNKTVPLVIFSTGASETSNKYSGNLIASFENAAPLVFDGLERIFMSIVPVIQDGTGTSGTETVGEYEQDNKFIVSEWTNTNGTGTTDDDTYFKGRVCGIAGTGADGVDPWCFAATGVTDELAVASAAGAAGALRSAFSNMTSQQLFTLMALTADGAYLATDPAGNAFSEEGLISYLQDMYELPAEYEYRVEQGGENYLDVFKEVFGYGVINLERATTPGKTIYFFDGSNIVSGSGNAYWRAASNTVFRPSAAFGSGTSTISAPFYDVLESFDGEMSLPRVWENQFALGATGKRGLYMGDVLGEFKTRDEKPQRVQFGDFGFSMSISEKPYADNLNGLDDMRVDYTRGDWNFAAGYQRHFTDGASRFDGMANPVLNLASNAVVSDVAYNMGRWSFGARAFSGTVTDETMLDNDPTVSAQYLPAQLGLAQGAQSDVVWNGDNFGFTIAAGMLHETDTLLGAMSGGLLDMGNGDTTYVDTELRFVPTDALAFKLRSTFARTTADASGQFIMGMTDIDSNAFAFGVDAGNFSFSVSAPLAISSGAVMYPYANYEVVEMDDGKYDLNITDAHIANINLRPEAREVRFTGTYRHNFGEFTDGAFGFIYRVNPNNTSEFGNESIFMMKLTHRVGI